MVFWGLRPIEWAIVATITALVFIVGRLPERGGKGTRRGRRAGK